MSLRVFNNTDAINAQISLNSNSVSMYKSIERMSSGLRLNQSSDGAVEFSMAEKMRKHLGSISTAFSNSQDAVSYLQTAEGGMDSITSLLHRMHDLAVQGADGTLTSNDRRELQKELDQIKVEINRVSVATEFNTQKLLTGASVGAWSSNNTNLDVIFKEKPVDGNYKLEFKTATGRNAVYKTSIFGYATTGVLTAITRNTINGIAELKINADLDVFSETAMKNIHSEFIVGDNESPANYLPDLASSGLPGVYLTDASVAVAMSDPSMLTDPSSEYGLYFDNLGDFATFDGFYVGIEFSVSGVTTSAGDPGIKFMFTVWDPATGASYESSVIADIMSSSATVNFDNGASMTFKSPSSLIWNDANIVDDDKLLFSIQNYVALNANEKIVGLNVPLLSTATITLNSSAPQINWNITTPGKYTAVTIADGQFYTIPSTWVSMGGNVGVENGSIDFLGMEIREGMKILQNTEMKDLPGFTNLNGQMILDNTQILTIYGNGRSTAITIESSDTVEDFANKMSVAIGIDLNLGSKEIANADLAKFITASGTGHYSVGGTVVLQAAMIGKTSELKFAGSEDLIRALGISQIQNAVDSDLTVDVVDAHTGKYLTSERATERMLRHSIHGTEIRIDNNLGITTSFDKVTGKISFTAEESTSVYLHIKDKSTSVHIDADENQMFDISIARMDSLSLGIVDAYVLSMEEAQNSLMLFEQAIDKIGQARARLGGQINRMEYAMNCLTSIQQSYVTAESRIRDLDVAAESSVFTRQQLIMNAGTAMLAQANLMPERALSLITG